MSNILSDVLSSQLFADAGSFSQEVSKAAEAVSGAAPISVAISVFSVLGTIVIALSALPQTIKTFKDRDTANISFLLFFLTGVATLFLTLYGIGLVTVPMHSSNFLVNIVQGNEQEGVVYIFNREEWVAGYLVPGILLIAGEFFACVTSFIVAFIKLSNSLKAKKAGMSETAYYESFIKPNLKVKGAK